MEIKKNQFTPVHVSHSFLSHLSLPFSSFSAVFLDFVYHVNATHLSLSIFLPCSTPMLYISCLVYQWSLGHLFKDFAYQYMRFA
jgi:hypothetical protein